MNFKWRISNFQQSTSTTARLDPDSILGSMLLSWEEVFTCVSYFFRKRLQHVKIGCLSAVITMMKNAGYQKFDKFDINSNWRIFSWEIFLQHILIWDGNELQENYFLKLKFHYFLGIQLRFKFSDHLAGASQNRGETEELKYPHLTETDKKGTKYAREMTFLHSYS